MLFITSPFNLPRVYANEVTQGGVTQKDQVMTGLEFLVLPTDLRKVGMGASVLQLKFYKNS